MHANEVEGVITHGDLEDARVERRSCEENGVARMLRRDRPSWDCHHGMESKYHWRRMRGIF